MRGLLFCAGFPEIIALHRIGATGMEMVQRVLIRNHITFIRYRRYQGMQLNRFFSLICKLDDDLTHHLTQFSNRLGFIRWITTTFLGNLPTRRIANLYRRVKYSQILFKLNAFFFKMVFWNGHLIISEVTSSITNAPMTLTTPGSFVTHRNHFHRATHRHHSMKPSSWFGKHRLSFLLSRFSEKSVWRRKKSTKSH